MTPHAPQWTVHVAALLALTAISGCQLTSVREGSAGPSTSYAPATDADAQLARLTVAKTGSMKGYSREKFPHWRSTGQNCNVRDSVLKRDGTKVKTSGCNVVAGTWKSEYDGRVLNSPTKVDVDHVVPLANAWRSGASAWTTDKRGDFANDLDHPQLVAVSAAANRAKGDQDPSTWKPTQTRNWCDYAEDWITVKSHWKLTMTSMEKVALTDMLETC